MGVEVGIELGGVGVREDVAKEGREGVGDWLGFHGGNAVDGETYLGHSGWLVLVQRVELAPEH